MEQVITTPLFFDGYSARPAPVQIRLSGGQLLLHDPYDDFFLQSFPLSSASLNRVGQKQFLYLDTRGLVYLQFDAEHPLLHQIERELEASKRGWAQKLMQQKLVLLVPVLLVLAGGLYFLLLSLVPFLGLRMISRESEITLGNHLHQVMLNEVDLIGGSLDTSGTYKLRAFARQMQLSKAYPIRVTLVHSRIKNAYALPGGQVVVYTGLLKEIKSPEALAALLAHESTHVNERHSLRSLLRSGANSLLVSILFGDATGITGALTVNVENLSGLRYSRSLESEADERGMDLMRANGISPQGMVDLMKTLQQEGGDIPGELSFLSSHPLTKDRIKAAEAYCRQHSAGKTGNEALKLIFDDLKRTVRFRK